MITRGMKRLNDVLKAELTPIVDKDRDYSNSKWKPMMRHVKEDKFPWHAYVVSRSEKTCDIEGRYFHEIDAKLAACGYANMLNR